MALTQLLAQTSNVATGSPQLLGTTVGKRTFQTAPQPGVGFTGVVVINGSDAPNPGANDWFPLATLTFSAHTSNTSFDMFDETPWLRVDVTAASAGACAVYLSA